MVRVAGVGTVAFQRDGMPPISFTDVLYVPGMKKNLISVSTLQDRGLEVTFTGTEVLIHCNVPKPRCKEHHGFGCLLKLFWLWHPVKHFVDLPVYMCLLAGWPLDFGLMIDIPQPYAI